MPGFPAWRAGNGTPAGSGELGGKNGGAAEATVYGEGHVYAIINDGSHQYRVEEGQIIDVQRRDLPEGTTAVEFDRVLFVGDREGGPVVGQPVVEGARVTASVAGEVKGDKIIIRKLRRRKNYSLKKGHRQKYLRVKIEKIEA